VTPEKKSRDPSAAYKRQQRYNKLFYPFGSVNTGVHFQLRWNHCFMGWNNTGWHWQLLTLTQ